MASQAAYLRNGINAGPVPTYFNLQPRFGSVEHTQPKVQKTYTYAPYHPKLIPSAIQENHTRQAISLKPTPLTRRTVQALDNHTAGITAHQGYGRHQNRGLAYKMNGRDTTRGPLLVQADSTYAGLNNQLGIPR